MYFKNTFFFLSKKWVMLNLKLIISNFLQRVKYSVIISDNPQEKKRIQTRPDGLSLKLLQ